MVDDKLVPEPTIADPERPISLDKNILINDGTKSPSSFHDGPKTTNNPHLPSPDSMGSLNDDSDRLVRPDLLNSVDGVQER